MGLRKSLLVFFILCFNRFGVCDWATLRGNPQRTGFVASQPRPPFRLAWVRYFVNERIGTCVEPIVADGKVFVTTHNGSVYALDAETGQPLWRFRAHGAFLHSPAYAEGSVIAASADGCLYALDAETGQLRWFVFVGHGGFAASPTIDKGTVLIGSRTGKFVAVDLSDGKIRWQRDFEVPIRQTASTADGRVFVTAEDLRVRCLDIKTGKVLWVSKPLNGQTARDYYPVIAKVNGKTFVIIRTNPVLEMSHQIGRDREFLCKIAGIADGWQAIEAWTRSEKAKGSPDLWEREQAAIIRYLQDNRDFQTFFALDAETGEELPPSPILWVAGCQGVGTPPVVLPDGRLLVLYRSAYGNWNLGVAPLVALGLLDLTKRRIIPLFHAHGMMPPWNTFWGTVAFNDSGELFEALAWAYPHLTADLQRQVKDFLAREWQIHPPFAKSAWYPPNEGNPREWFPVPSELRKDSGDLHHPFGNLYAVWLWASRCGEWERVRASWEAIRSCLGEFTESGWQLNPERGDLMANRYLASLIAFRKLAERFGDSDGAARAQRLIEATQNALLAWWERSAKQMSLPVFRDINEWDAFIRDGDAL
ncbi:outer membrane protein assembly factor BamB family protein, partial [Fervidibacter sp.]